ncbi:MAG: hypothetical protein H6708_24440 [Kofleriaceae bacterium]|nr:hypothetical protein [Kofleriaceae bacterium]
MHKLVPSLVTAVVLTVAARGVATADVGARGTVAVESSLAFEASRESSTRADTTRSRTTLGLAGAVHYLVLDRLSVGGQAYAAITWHDDDHDDATFAVPTAGYVVPLGARAHLWPRAGLAFVRERKAIGGVQHTIAIDLSVPLVVEPAPHWYVGLAPRYTRTLLNTDDGEDDPTHTTYGVFAILGVYLDP